MYSFCLYILNTSMYEIVTSTLYTNKYTWQEGLYVRLLTIHFLLQILEQNYLLTYNFYSIFKKIFLISIRLILQNLVFLINSISYFILKYVTPLFIKVWVTHDNETIKLQRSYQNKIFKVSGNIIQIKIFGFV